nr:MAG TPA: hypothetical protein [Bacteriophage sp.]DAZ69403.1 MAG TPA: hypothetical protein [Caudoviricetes sp.]
MCAFFIIRHYYTSFPKESITQNPKNETKKLCIHSN